MNNSRVISNIRRHRRIRAKLMGTPERPRLCVHKSLRHLRVQLIDDAASKTLVSLSTLMLKTTGKLASASQLGKEVAAKAQALGIKEIVFDRGGYPYHGQVKMIAEAAREVGLIF